MGGALLPAAKREEQVCELQGATGRCASAIRNGRCHADSSAANRLHKLWGAEEVHRKDDKGPGGGNSAGAFYHLAGGGETAEQRR